MEPRSAGTVARIRRYPVKSMGGEDVATVTLDERGVLWDRWYAVVDADGFLASGKDTRRFRRRDGVFDYSARTTEQQGVIVSGRGGSWSVGDPALDAALSERMGVPVRVLPEREVQHQDTGPLSLVGTATLAWCAENWGIDADSRRLRVNLVVETDTPFVEETWVGSTVMLGATAVRVTERLPRCRMVDIDQDGAVAQGRWLTPLGRERDTCLAVCAEVLLGGQLRVGDPVSLVAPTSG